MKLDPHVREQVERQLSDAANPTPRWVGSIGLTVAVGVAYFLAARLSLFLLTKPDGVAVFWPAAGVASGTLIALGRGARWPVAVGTMAATIVANTMGDRSLWSAIAFALCNAGEALLVAWLIARYFGSDFSLGRLRQVLGLLAAAIVGPAASGVGGTVAYRLLHSPDAPVLTTWQHWFASDALGIITVAPLVIGLASFVREPPPRSELIEGSVALVALAAMTGIIISLPPQPWETVVPVALLFPLLLWLAARCRSVFTSAAVFIVSVTIVWAITFGIGHFGTYDLSMDDLILSAQASILGVALCAFVLAALFAERRQHAADLSESLRQQIATGEVLKARTRALAKSLEDLRTAQDRLIQTENLASLGHLTAGIAHEIKNPLNFVNNFSAISIELVDELRQALDGAPLETKLRAEIGELANMLQGNLDKVVQHGKRADSIVRNMLLHSRQGSGERRPVDINAMVEESLNLAYHGARAENQGFNITLERSFDPTAGEADLFPQEITRVLLNLISNGFYAATKRKAEANGGDCEPTLAAATRNLGDSVEIRIRDNGTGIRPEVKERMFKPFFTTKPAGEGTGLGLSISYDIIVKRHAGSIEIDTRLGEFTEFRIVLPRAGATIARSGERA